MGSYVVESSIKCMIANAVMCSRERELVLSPDCPTFIFTNRDRKIVWQSAMQFVCEDIRVLRPHLACSCVKPVSAPKLN